MSHRHRFFLLPPLCSLLLTMAFSQQAGWHAVSSLPPTVYHEDVSARSADDAIVVGGAVIRRTTDRGASWTVPYERLTDDLTALRLISADTAFVAGNKGTIAITTDAGASWHRLPTGLTHRLTALDMPDRQHGWVVGDDGVILRTTDDGATWALQMNLEGRSLVEAVGFGDSDSGVVTGFLGGHGMIRTTDGGVTWSNVDLGVAWPTAVHFEDAAHGWMVGVTASYISVTWSIWGDVIRTVLSPYATQWRTTDGGRTWQPLVRTATHWLRCVEFADTLNGWCGGDGGALYRTTDGGVTWPVVASGTSSAIRAIHLFSATDLIVVGSGGVARRSTDAGATWTAMTTGVTSTLTGLQFIDVTRGMIVGGSGLVLGTTNGGASWQQLSGPPTPTLKNIEFANDLNAWACGYAGTIMATTDAGSTWRPQVSQTTKGILATSFVSPSEGWATAERSVLKTTDGGGTWIEHPTISPYYFADIWFIDATTGWVVESSGGHVLKTTDGGDTWTSIAIPGAPAMSAIQFIDRNDGWVATGSGLVLRTTDGGSSWAPSSTGSTSGVTSLVFVDSAVGWVSSGTGIWKTTNGGRTWGRQGFGPVTSIVSGVSAVDRNVAWAITGYEAFVTLDGGGHAAYPPEPAEPLNASSDVPVSTTVRWSSTPLALSYQLQLSRTSTFSSLDVVQGGISDTSFVLSGLDSDCVYYWRVRADYASDTSQWSDAARFETVGAAWRQKAVNGAGNFWTVAFIDSVRGWAVDYACVWRTTDGGITWTKIAVAGSSGLTDVSFASSTHGWVGDGAGHIYATWDGGASWHAQTSGVSVPIIALHFPSVTRGYAATGEGLLRTTDGGNLWTNVTTGILTNAKDVRFLDEERGWVTSSNTPYLVTTTDGGATWRTPGFGYPGSSIWPIDTLQAWVSGYAGHLGRTTDGGVTWDDLDQGVPGTLTSIVFSDPLNGWCTGEQGTILRTTDGGVRWGTAALGSDADLKSIAVVGQRAWVVAGDDTVRRTSIGGGRILFAPSSNQPSDHATGIGLETKLTWSPQGTSGRYVFEVAYDEQFSEIMASAEVVGDSSFTLLGLDSLSTYWWRVRSIDDAGASPWSTRARFETVGPEWFLQTSGTVTSLLCVDFIDAQIGWATNRGTTLFRTSDGGAVWNGTATSGTSGLSGVRFFDATTGIGYGTSSIYSTTDAGVTWAPAHTLAVGQIKAMAFGSATSGWCVGTAGTILRTTDGGAHWTLQTSGTTADLTCVEAVGDAIGWAGGMDAAVVRTVDGGASWQPVNIGLASYLDVQGISFAGTQDGIVATYFGFHRTTDGGGTWTPQLEQYEAAISGVRMLSPLKGWAVANGAMFVTTNGTRWHRRSVPTTSWLRSLVLMDDSTGWAVGSNGTILQLGYRQRVVGVLSGDRSAPTTLALDQNFPNPFNPRTEIRFSVPAAGSATVRLYNLVGQCVATLFDGPVTQATSLRVFFDGGHLPSGVYVCRLDFHGAATGADRSGSRVRKLMLLK